MKSATDNFSIFFSSLAIAFQRLGGPSSPAQRHTLLRPGSRFISGRQSPSNALAISGLPARAASAKAGSNRASIPGRICSHLVLIFIVSAFYSCSTKSSAPEGILSKDEMARVMTEFYIKESKINSLRIDQDSALILFQYYREKHEEESNISNSVIEKSYQYYLNKPAELSEIYDRIIDSLALKEQRTTVPVKKY